MPAGHGLSQPQTQYKPPRFNAFQSSQLDFRSCKPGVDRHSSQEPAAVATGCSMGSAGEDIAGSANAQESRNQTSPSRKRKRQVAVSSFVPLWCDPADAQGNTESRLHSLFCRLSAADKKSKSTQRDAYALMHHALGYDRAPTPGRPCTCCHTCSDAVGFSLCLLLQPTLLLLMHSQEAKTVYEVFSSYRLKASGDTDLSA